jgi:16S rRNA (adenine1518-N6/adenine1519-N6)-dimethyltransferase
MRARKRFGQHFLEPAWQVKVLTACAVAPGDTVLEIGPGRGALTITLAERAAHVLAVELDRDLAAALAARQLPRLQVVSGDFLRQDWDALMAAWERPTQGPVRVVGNLPYNVSSPILFRLLEVAATHPALTDATLMLQAEVADRILARSGTRDYGVLTLLTALRADVEPLLELPPGAFRPVPTVRSALVRLRFRPLPAGVTRPTEVSRLVRTAFTQRRKTIGNALKALGTADGRDPGAVLRAAGIDPIRRPETLQLVEYSALADAWALGPVL